MAGLLTSSSIQGQECSDKEGQLAELLKLNLNEMERGGILNCLDLEGLFPTLPSKGGSRTEIPEVRMLGHKSPETSSLFSAALPPSWFGYVGKMPVA